MIPTYAALAIIGFCGLFLFAMGALDLGARADEESDYLIRNLHEQDRL